jgi:hypothetical protein
VLNVPSTAGRMLRMRGTPDATGRGRPGTRRVNSPPAAPDSDAIARNLVTAVVNTMFAPSIDPSAKVAAYRGLSLPC